MSFIPINDLKQGCETRHNLVFKKAVKRRLVFECHCGNTFDITHGRYRRDQTTHCGCLKDVTLTKEVIVTFANKSVFTAIFEGTPITKIKEYFRLGMVFNVGKPLTNTVGNTTDECSPITKCEVWFNYHDKKTGKLIKQLKKL